MKVFFELLASLLAFGRGVFVFIVLVSASLLMLHSDDKSKRGMVEMALSSFLYPVQATVQVVMDWRDLEKENAKLKKDNASLRLQNDLLRQAKSEVERLRAMVDFESQWDYPILLSQVIGRNPGRLQTTLLINRGSGEGISPGMPVYTPKGLVGKISKVNHGHSFVQLLMDPTLKISVMEQRTRTVGILESPDSRKLVAVVPTHAQLRKGDTVFTSGLGGVFPKGILVGIVTSVEQSDLDVIRKAYIHPLQDPSLVEEVFVVQKDLAWTIQEELVP